MRTYIYAHGIWGSYLRTYIRNGKGSTKVVDICPWHSKGVLHWQYRQLTTSQTIFALTNVQSYFPRSYFEAIRTEKELFIILSGHDCNIKIWHIKVIWDFEPCLVTKNILLSQFCMKNILCTFTYVQRYVSKVRSGCCSDFLEKKWIPLLIFFFYYKKIQLWHPS